MSDRGKSDRREVPASVWWCIVFAAYSWGYAEGRRAGSLEGFARAMRTWMDVTRAVTHDDASG